MSGEIAMYIQILGNYIEKYIIIGIIIFIFVFSVFLFRLVKKEKIYAMFTMSVLILFSVVYLFMIKDAFVDYKEQTIIVNTGTIQHNVSDSFIAEDILFIPQNSDESISINDNFLSGVNCPYGKYRATIVYGENSKILLYVHTE